MAFISKLFFLLVSLSSSVPLGVSKNNLFLFSLTLILIPAGNYILLIPSINLDL